MYALQDTHTIVLSLKTHFFKNKSKIIHYGIEIESFPNSYNKNNEKKYFKGRKFPIIAMIGSLWKNQEELIRITPILKKEFPDITVALIGSGSEQQKNKLLKLAEKLNVNENITITGQIDRHFLVTYIFQDIDLLVSTYKNEGFGIIYLEAIASYIPVVAYKSGGIPEIIEKGGGFLVNGSERNLALKIIQILKDKDFRHSLSLLGKSNVENNFSLNNMAENFIRFYKGL